MAKKLKVGDVIRGYRITKVFGPGMMAISYGAEAPAGAEGLLQAVQVAGPDGRLVPGLRRLPEGAVRPAWRGGKADNFAVRQLDAFEEIWGGRCYFSGYEFVENGADLQQCSTRSASSIAGPGRAPTRRSRGLGPARHLGARCSWPGSRRCTRRRSSMPT